MLLASICTRNVGKFAGTILALVSSVSMDPALLGPLTGNCLFFTIYMEILTPCLILLALGQNSISPNNYKTMFLIILNAYPTFALIFTIF